MNNQTPSPWDKNLQSRPIAGDLSQIYEFDLLPSIDADFTSANENTPPPPVQKLSAVGLEVMGKQAQKLRFILKNGNRHVFSYAFIVEVIFEVEGCLSIYTSEREIIILGRGLDKVEEWIFESRVTWIREDARSFDPQDEEVFVAKIEVNKRK